MAEIHKMTEEQRKLLEELEEEFKDRYTEEDEDYKRVIGENELIPPIVERWDGGGDRNDRNDRNDRYNRYNRRNDRNDRYDRHDRHDRRRDHYYNNDNYNRGYQNQSYERGYRDYSYETNSRSRNRPY